MRRVTKEAVRCLECNTVLEEEEAEHVCDICEVDIVGDTININMAVGTITNDGGQMPDDPEGKGINIDACSWGCALKKVRSVYEDARQRNLEVKYCYMPNMHSMEETRDFLVGTAGIWDVVVEDEPLPEG